MKRLIGLIQYHIVPILLFGSLFLLIAAMNISYIIKSFAPTAFVMMLLSGGAVILLGFWQGRTLVPDINPSRSSASWRQWSFNMLFLLPLLMTAFAIGWSMSVYMGFEDLARYRLESYNHRLIKPDTAAVLMHGLYTGLFSFSVSAVSGIVYALKDECRRFSDA